MRSRARDNPVLVFITLVLISFVLMTFDVQSAAGEGLLGRVRSGAASLLGPVERAADSVIDPVASLIDGVVSFATLRSENERMAIELQQLRAELADTDRLVAEIDQLRRVQNLRSSLSEDLPTVAAEVQSMADDGSLTIDKGRQHGILMGFPVLDEAGNLLGRVVAVAEQQATVRLLPNFDDVVEVSTPTEMRGAVSGTGRPGELRFDVYTNAGVTQPESLLSTLGTNGYPPGLPVAMVTDLIEPIGDQITDARVVPTADFSRMPRFVVVVQFADGTVVTADEPDEQAPEDATGEDETGEGDAEDGDTSGAGDG